MRKRNILSWILAGVLTILMPAGALAYTSGDLEQRVQLATGITRIHSPLLESVAQVRVIEIQAVWAHRPLTELTSAGWAYGEVLGNARFTSDPIGYTVTGWMLSPTHNIIITDPGYTHIGCAHALGTEEWNWFVCIVGIPPGGGQIIGPPIVEFIPDTHM